MITMRLIGEFQPDQFALKSAGMMGAKHTLTLENLSLLGEAGTLDCDLPVTIVELQERVLGVPIGPRAYIVTQPGARMLDMIEGTADSIVHVIRHV